MSNQLTVREAAKEARTCEETIRRWIRSGALPARRMGGRFLVEPADLARGVDLSKAAEQ